MEENKALSMDNITFGYDKDLPLIENFSLDVEKGSFTTLLGESGCGKTTLLRLIAGFLTPQRGGVYIDGIDQKGIPVEKRNIGIVFQDYALFPHMSVRDNIAYGLKIKKTSDRKHYSREEIASRVEETANSLGLEKLLSRYPHELSGGQQQRVALARAVILSPDLLLMDEPLSSLDTKLREKVRQELKEFQHKLKITTIYVTHDREEALSLSDKIAVLNKGRLMQYESPLKLYFEPSNDYTADFIGHTNFITLDDCRYMVRPEWLSLSETKEVSSVEGVIISSSFLGDKIRFVIEISNGQRITADLATQEGKSLKVGQNISLTVNYKCLME